MDTVNVAESIGRIFDHRLPPVTMGWGARARLPAILSEYGTKVLVVIDPGVVGQEVFQDVLNGMSEASLETELFRDISPDPPVEEFLACGELARQSKADLLVGIGGGSALDVTKIAAVLGRHDCSLDDLFGIDQVPGRGFPTVLVPTTAGTGSEVTPIAVASDETNQLKRGIVSDHLIADHALVDPEFCVTLPPGPTAYTGMDALTHAIEAYTNKFAVPLIDMYALEAIRLITKHLPRAVKDGSDVEARFAMSKASMLGGFCLGPVNTAAVHALAYPLGGRFEVPHGMANSLLLPHVMRFNWPMTADRYADIAKAMGSDDAVIAVEELSAAVGTNRPMREFGVEQHHLPEMAHAAMEVTRLMKNNPRAVTEEDVLAIYQQAW